MSREWLAALALTALVLAGLIFALSRLGAALSAAETSIAPDSYQYPPESAYLASSEHLIGGAFLIGGPDVSAALDDSLSRDGVEETIGELTTIEGVSLLASTPPHPNEDFGPARDSKITYFVQPGDTLSGLAEKFGISQNTILWANNLRSVHSLTIGQKLEILPVDGVIHTIKKGDTVSSVALKYKGDIEEIIAFNDLPADGFLSEGAAIIIPDGAMPLPRFYTSNQSQYLTSLPYYAGYYLMPTTGFNWKRLHPHNATDIANTCGTPIYAAAAGTVAISDEVGWNGGYGKYIRINHLNGTATLYAHNSRNLVVTGASVTQGQQIALMGTTGRSTGCHVHFEVRGARNPFL